MNMNTIMKFDKRHLTYYIAGGVGISILLGGIYYYWKKVSKVKLNPWLEEYFKEVQEMKKNSKGEICVELIGHIFQLISEVEEFLYLGENKDLEEARIVHVDSEKDYRALFSETMEARTEFYEKAQSLVESRLGISIAQIEQEGLSKLNSPEDKAKLRNARKKYDDVPEVAQANLREAFKYFVTHKKINDHRAQEQQYMASINPEYKTKAMAAIYLAKNKLQDEIRAKYKFDDKYFDQLLEKHGLLSDPEIKLLYDEWKLIE